MSPAQIDYDSIAEIYDLGGASADALQSCRAKARAPKIPAR